MEFIWAKIETLLLLVIILLQLVLIFLVLRRGEPRLVFEGLGIRRESQSLKETTERGDASLENLWENPPPASEELKSTVAEFKGKYNRSEPWDGDFVL